MEDEEMFKVKFIFNEEQLEISLNSQYDYFINSICSILKITKEQFNNLIVSYIDSDEDNIILSSPEDYDIFFQQIAQKQIDNFKIKIKENCDLDQNQCLINLLEYKDQQELKNNNENKINEDENINNNHQEDNNININNINNIYQERYNINEFNDYFEQNKKDNEDIPIDNLIFDYKCNNCQIYPIVCKIFYCDKCQYYLCEDCEKKGVFHEHNLFVIDSREELKKIKEKENDELDKNRKEIEKIMEQDKTRNQRNIYNNNNFNNYNYPSDYQYNYPPEHQYNYTSDYPYNYQYYHPYNYPPNYQYHYPYNHQINFPINYQSNRTRNFGHRLVGKNKGGRIFYYIIK